MSYMLSTADITSGQALVLVGLVRAPCGEHARLLTAEHELLGAAGWIERPLVDCPKCGARHRWQATPTGILKAAEVTTTSITTALIP